MLLQVLSNCRENILLLTPDCGLDLECGNLTLVCDTPSNYALSFDEVSLNCFRSDFKCNLTSDLIVTLTLGTGI